MEYTETQRFPNSLQKVFFRGREEKMNILANVFQPYLSGEILDVGCDRQFLKPRVTGRYIGIDRYGTPDIYVNVEEGLPFKDQSFETIIAMDILEHLEHIHAAFDELTRVASRRLIIGLPNMYEWRSRLLFLMGRKMSGKYGLPIERPADRHRWLFSFWQARQFVHYRGKHQGFHVVQEVIGYYRYNNLVAKWMTTLGSFLPPDKISLFVYHYWALLERTSPNQV